jgi:hypothetical protein
MLGDPDPIQRAVSEEQKWEAEKAFREREVSVQEREVAAKEAELGLTKKGRVALQWKSPLVVAVIGATLAAVGNAVVVVLNGQQQRLLEKEKFEHQQILEMIKVGNDDREKVKTNLQFLLEVGLVTDLGLREKMESVLKQPAKIPVLPAPAPVISEELPVARQLAELVERADYQEASKLFETLTKSHFSGVGYSAYPKAAFAFDQIDKPDEALRVLNLLADRLKQDEQKGYGYLAAGRPPRTFLKDDFNMLIPKVRSPEVKKKMEELRDLLSKQ